ncbi:PKD domain-containing protein [archaeon]|nr:PKD domain-containing protein [archaeon]
MRKGWISLLVCLMILPLALATFSINNHTLETEYILGEVIRGAVNLSISGESSTSTLSSNFAGEKTLEEFLNSNGKSNFCSTRDCIADFSSSNPELAKTLTLSNGDNKTVGFVLNGSVTGITGITFNISSNFPESVGVPLALDFADSIFWEYDIFSGNYGNIVLSYNSSAPRENQLIGSLEYCQKVEIPKTNSIRVKPSIAETSFGNLTITLYTSDGSDIGQCQYSDEVISGCILESSDVYYGEHYVCVGDETGQGLNLRQESMSTDNHGYTRNSGDILKVNVNYIIDVSAETYEDSSNLSVGYVLEDFATAASNYISIKYNGDCSSSCVLPLTFSGIAQELVLSNLQIIYISGTEKTENNFYLVEESAPTVDFNGVLDLAFLDFTVDDDEFKLYFDGDEVLDEDLNLTESIILDIYPREVPAGVPIDFQIVSDANLSNVNFEWYFGDDVNETSRDPNKTHTYANITNYTLTVIAKVNNATEEKSFIIASVSPLEVIQNVLSRKKEVLDFIGSKADNSSISSEIKSTLNISGLWGEWTAIAIRLNGSTSEDNYSAIATDLFDLTIPLDFTITESQDFLSPTSSEIDLVALTEASGENIPSGSEVAYKSAIQKWFANNIEITSTEKRVDAEYEGSAPNVEFSHYSLVIKSDSSNQSYLIINQPLSSMQFKSGVVAKSAGASTYIELSSGYRQTVQFILSGDEAPVIFVSPQPSILILDEADRAINEDCNFDGICQEGENSKNCRNDCRPRNLIIYYLILIVFLFVVSFFGVTIWYQRHKEEILFGDRRQLFNLVNFIKSAREKKLDDKKIESMLIEKGWVIERVKYALEKSKKVDGVSISSFNNFIDKKIYAQSATPPIKQQVGQKTNKPNSQNIRRTP